VGPNSLSVGLRSVDGVVGFAHKATSVGQEVAEGISRASLAATKAGLRAAGAQEGELLRCTIGTEAAEAVTAVEAMVRRFAGPLQTVPLSELVAAARAWGAMQQAAMAVQETPLGEVAALPELSERWMRFTAATFGAAWFAGLVEGFSVSAAARARAVSAQGGEPGAVALAFAGVEGCVEVLAFEQSTRELYAPGYLAAVDYEHEAVVVALRGTSSMADTLADLVCEPAVVQLGGLDGIAHGGMLKAAQRLDATLASLVEAGLAKLAPTRRSDSPLRVRICGHSLGAGVAALLAALWRDAGRFPGVDVRCLALACPQVLDARLAAAVGNHTTSVVLGDDLVPRLSLATAHDLREVLLRLWKPTSYGLPSSLGAQEALEAAERGEADRLAAAHATLRHVACTSPNRLFPAGRLLHLAPGRPPRAVGHEAVDELRITQDMAAAHMPRRYLLALQEAATLAG